MKNNFYITTTLPYVNAPLHLGHATEIIRADAIARYKKLQGCEVFFNTGTDEHGMKIADAAKTAGQTPQEYTDQCAILFKETLKKFGVADDDNFLKAHYIRTTDEHHVVAAQAFWQKCTDNGFIYKKNYKTKYCVGCEEEKTDSELIDGKCSIHPNLELEVIDEENYFFKYSEFGDRLLKYYDANPNFIIPDYRTNELREFIKRGLNDFSVSRLKSKMSWGIPVPGDDEHVMYVWFDALTNYISTLGWPDNLENFEKFWSGADTETVQFCGKDNTRFQGAMWQAMLMAADIKGTDKIIVDGFIMGEGGVKMSKSLGNVIDPLEIINEYNSDILRYFILREFHPFEDTPVSAKSLKDSYNANLANGLGNTVSRVMKMAEGLFEPISDSEKLQIDVAAGDYVSALENYNMQNAMNVIWHHVGEIDKTIQETEPFKLVKTDKEAAAKIIKQQVVKIDLIARMLAPFMPETAAKISQAVALNKKPDNLFSRKD
jgi:methionyl-tRNA synthetase